MDLPILDLAILGGGPAGRARLTTVVISDERPRNRVTKASHGFFTRDGAHARELIQHGVSDLEQYETVEYVVDTATRIAEEGQGFLIQRASGPEVHARRVVIATGHRDDLEAPAIPNLAEVYGTSLFPCPFCDGYEHRDQGIAIIGTVGIDHMVPMVRVWSKDVHLFSNGQSLPSETRAAMDRNKVTIHDAPIDELIHEEGHLTAIRVGDQVIPRDAGFIAGPFSHPATTFADDLGVPREPHPWGLTTYQADAFGRTDVPGVYVVGDAHTGFARLLAAATEGARCVERIVAELAKEAWT